ncbi:MFS transporter [Streptococcus loxodontisalivarius]|uniref:EmrB/QacA subfamily drug resistance transporter n=1 Tax=Streptococcus loxodontisalivarius TaxID=1349415 RepID=A0ABS2PUN1_9STRE|nr:MFS transporter [Streptococcus loxodontisalivarius]MBM7643643.1 EmrB/QacA subfamily drug resistance transporter [Streptococcus loxodontisalivarius]
MIKWRVIPAIIATAVLSFAGVLIETSMNVTFPTLMSEFGVDAAAIQWVTTGNLLAVAVTVPLSAYLIKRFSERRLFLLANLVFILGVIFDGLSPNLLILLLGRILQGVGTGLALPLMIHMIMTRVAKEKQGFIMGLATMTTSLAPALGPTYGGLVLDAFGWHAIFSFLLPVLVLSALVGLMSIPQEERNSRATFNVSAFIFLTLGLAASLLAIEKMSLLWLLLAVVALLIFYRFNRKPLIRLAVLKNSAFFSLTMVVLAFQMMALGLSFVLPNHLQLGLGLSSSQAGFFMFPGAILVAVILPISGLVYDKVGGKLPISTGIVISLLGLLIMSVFFKAADANLLLICDIIALAGAGIASGNGTTMALSQLNQEDLTDGNSILSTLQQFSGALSTALVSQLFTLGQKQGSIALGGQLGIYLLLVVMILALLFFLKSFTSKR